MIYYNSYPYLKYTFIIRPVLHNAVRHVMYATHLKYNHCIVMILFGLFIKYVIGIFEHSDLYIN